MAEIAKLVPRLQYSVKRRHFNLKNTAGPLGRIDKIRRSLSALYKYERIELHLPRCTEVRGYAERLITEAIRHGDQHPATMDLADFWLMDKQMIHKLFKVYVPRYQNFHGTYTEKYLLPDKCHLAAQLKNACFIPLCLLEMKGNPYPPILKKPKADSASLTNVLLRAASKDFKINQNTKGQS